MRNGPESNERHIGLLGATGIGVGAIVGGGILALAGVAFATTGPSAILAFALNGLIALLTAVSFAEMASKFPESGGTYTFARKVLSVESAFTVGWVVWFASIVAAVLYALGFAHFAAIVFSDIATSCGFELSSWATSGWFKSIVAIGITLGLTARLVVASGSGGHWANIGKVAVFGVLILGGLWAMARQPSGNFSSTLQPFFSNGWSGLVQAMGYTFIALQGFDLIAAVGGEVKNPEKTIPRAMSLSLLVALVIYLPLLFVIATVGVAADQSVVDVAQENRDEIVAVAANQYLGPFGYWLVMVAALLSMLTALQANVFAASRIALAMSRDRTLPSLMSRLSLNSRNPFVAIVATSAIIIALILVLPDVAVAGAASSLIFLVTFAIAHWLAILVRQRSIMPPPFRAPLFPAVPIIGGLCCLSLAIFQAIAVPQAGTIAILWLASGGLLFLTLFARRARFVDASSRGSDPELMTLRGRIPLVLVPIANPRNAEALMGLADALVPAGVGRVLVHNVVVAGADWEPEADDRPIQKSQVLMNEMLRASVRIGFRAEALTTVAPKPMDEIARVARLHQCDTVLVGLSNITDQNDGSRLEWLLGVINSDVVVLRAGVGWELGDAKKIMVPIAGQGGHDYLLARLLGSLLRDGSREVEFVRVAPENSSSEDIERAEKDLKHIALDNVSGQCTWKVILSNDPVGAIVQHAETCDLLILGAQRVARTQRLFGRLTRKITTSTDGAVIVMSSKR